MLYGIWSLNNAFITASAVTDLFYIIRKEMHDKDKTYVVMENHKDYEASSLVVVSPKECIELL